MTKFSGFGELVYSFRRERYRAIPLSFLALGIAVLSFTIAFFWTGRVNVPMSGIVFSLIGIPIAIYILSNFPCAIMCYDRGVVLNRGGDERTCISLDDVVEVRYWAQRVVRLFVLSSRSEGIVIASSESEIRIVRAVPQNDVDQSLWEIAMFVSAPLASRTFAKIIAGSTYRHSNQILVASGRIEVTNGAVWKNTTIIPWRDIGDFRLAYARVVLETREPACPKLQFAIAERNALVLLHLLTHAKSVVSA